jgi:putative FmdB family regulatory protein
MPLFDFFCDNCGAIKEEFLKLSEKEMPVCDKCGERMKKAMSAPAFILRGNGWYKDGYGLHEKKGGKKKNDS